MAQAGDEVVASAVSVNVEHLVFNRFDAYVGFRLRRAQQAVMRAFTEIAGNSFRQRIPAALGVIVDNPGISQNVVARALGIDKSATVQLIDELETHGYVVRRRAVDDRRRHALHATDAGREHLHKLESLSGELNQRLLTRLSQNEVALLNDLLDRVYLACVEEEDSLRQGADGTELAPTA